jgi:hypothetical protein
MYGGVEVSIFNLGHYVDGDEWWDSRSGPLNPITHLIVGFVGSSAGWRDGEERKLHAFLT